MIGIGAVANILPEDFDETNADAVYDRYSPDEWSHWEEGGTFSEVHKWVADAHREFDLAEKAWEDLGWEYEDVNDPIDNEVGEYGGKHVNRLYEATLTGMIAVKEQGGFSRPSVDDPFLVIWFPDADESERQRVRRSVVELNSPATVEKFERARIFG